MTSLTGAPDNLDAFPVRISRLASLSNIRARLAQLHPNAHDLGVSAPPGGGFTVVLSLPWREDPGATVADPLEIPAREPDAPLRLFQIRRHSGTIRSLGPPSKGRPTVA